VKQGQKFNYKIEKAADSVLHFLMNKQLDEAFELANKNLRKKNFHPTFVFAKSIEFLSEKDEEGFRAQFNKLSGLSSIRYTDYYNFGVFFQKFQFDVLAIECFDECVKRKDDFFEGYEQLGNSIFNLEEYESALGAYISALTLKPKHIAITMRAGMCCVNLGHYNKGLEFYKSLLSENPFDSDIRVGVARCLFELNRLSEVEALILNDIDHASEKEKDYFVLSTIYKDSRNFNAALAFAGKGYDINPNYLPIIKLYGSLLGRLNYHKKSLEILKVAVARDPADHEMLFNYGNAYQSLGQISEARKYFLKSIDLNPESHKAYNNLGFGYQTQGDHSKANECYRIALGLAPDRDDYHSNILFSMLHQESIEPLDHYQEARKWQEQHGAKSNEIIKEYNIIGDSIEKLKIGYISADFGDHVVSYHWLPIAKHHDRSKYDIYLYSQRSLQDELSNEINKEIDDVCDQRRDVSLMSDKELCEQIRNDKINILIDLSGHTAGNRLAALSFRPAPVQATYIGYPATTGLDAIDYFITQPLHTPLEAADVFSEKLAHIPGCTSYNIRKDAQNIHSKPLPYKDNGYITFGSFNRPNKISRKCVEAWAQIVAGVPNSRILIKGDDIIGSHFESLTIECMADAGVSRERLILRDRSDYACYLEEINEIDIGLDSFPFNGATTSFDMLFMGRGYISLKGAGAIQNIVGSSYLEYFGHSELIATSVESYIAKAIDVALNMDALEAIRLKLRDTFRHEISESGPNVCKGLEDAYDLMWKTYVSGKTKQHINVI
jgi:protein O-GlcNAc transferase